MLNRIYFDHNATTPLDPRVMEAMLPVMRQIHGNPSSVHSFGREARQAVEQARETVARCLGVEPSEIVFTAGGTESDNLAIKGAAWALREKGRHLVTSRIEHHAVLHACAYLVEHGGFSVTEVEVNGDGVMDPEAVESALRPDTILVSIMAANNEVGTLQPVAEIAQRLKRRGILFHVDAVQWAGKRALRPKEWGADLVSISAHKFYGPKGIGALWIRSGVKIHPIIHGGSHERKLRAGTESVIGITGLAKALELASHDVPSNEARVGTLRRRLEEGILRSIEEVRVNGDPTRRLEGTSNLCFTGTEAEALLIGLDLEGIAASSGSACTAGSIEPSHVLMAMGLSPADARASIRLSLGKGNTEEEVDRVLSVLPGLVKKLRHASR